VRALLSFARLSPYKRGVSEQGPVPFPVFEDETTDVISLADPGRRRQAKRDRCTLTLLTGVEAGLVYWIDADETVLGRGHGCRVRIEDSALSRKHCRIVKKGDAYILEDLGSTNGTFIDGEPVGEGRRLEDGVRIQMGRDTVLKFSIQDELEMRATRRLYESAMNDPLTGVYNRRYLDGHLDAEFAFASRHGTALSLLLIDADHFKRVNDSFGHAAGDTALRALAGHLKSSVRAEDMIARFGGEEFAVLAREITVEGALAVAERIRRSVEATPVKLDDGRSVPLTVSIGVVTMGSRRTFANADALLEAADEALYRAKEAGRNRSEGA
jgi:two-component system cell cycle response regulator